MFAVISTSVVGDRIMLLTYGGRLIKYKEMIESNLFIRQSQVEYASVNRVKEKLPYNLRKDSRNKRNGAAKRNHNKWKELKRKRMI